MLGSCDLCLLFPWWPSWLEHSALINVDAPGCGTSVVRGPTVHKLEGFHPGVQLYPKFTLPKVPTSCRANLTQPRPNQRGQMQISGTLNVKYLYDNFIWFPNCKHIL